MTFSVEVWQTQIQQKLQQTKDWLVQVKTRQAPYPLYGFLATMTLWPLLDALGAGQILPVMNALGTVAGSIGGNLIANKFEDWKKRADQLNEQELETLVSQDVADNPELLEALNTLLEKLEVIPQAYQGLSKADQPWFAQTLPQELAKLGSLKRLEASLTGAGIIIQDSQLRGGPRSVVGSSGQTIVTGDHNRVAGTIIEQQTIIHGLPGSDPAALRTAYLNRVLEKASYLSLAGIDPKAAGGSEAEAHLNLDAVYTALLTLTPEQQEQLPRAELAGRGERRLAALAQLNQHPRLVLLGDPGSGKSTFVNFVAICLAGENLKHARANLALLTAPLPDDEGKDEEEGQPWQQGALLPVPVLLRDFAARGLPPAGQPATAEHLRRFIVGELKTAALTQYARPLGEELLRQGGLLLLDGLDEVPAADQRRVQIKQAVEDFARTFKHCRILVTSRTYAYQEQDWRLPGFAEAVLAPFSSGQIRRFVDRWYAHIATLRGMHPDDAQGRAELLKRAIFNSDRLRSLAERPLLLTLMASLHAWRGGSLPEKREELYADAVDLLLDTWETRKVERDAQGNIVATEPSLTEWLKVDREAVRELLNQLAYQAHATQAEMVGTADVPQGDLVCGLMALSRNEAVNPALLVSYLSQRAGLLLPRGVGIYTFPHRTFQEYLAACHLTNETYPEPVADLARQEPDRWREVALLAGAKAFRGSRSTIWSLVEALSYQAVPDRTAAAQDDIWGAHLAGQALVEVVDVQNIHLAHQAKVERVKNWLVYILEQAALPATERAIASQNLAMLGDPRPGVRLRPDGLPDIAWCEVPAGSFVRGSVADARKDDIERMFYGDERPQQEIDLPAFRISRYPITNAQYAAFVKAGGYQEPDYWAVAAAAGYWREEGWVKRPILKGDKLVDEWVDRPFDYGHPFGLPNHPVVGVNWYEAVAFCAWLTEQLQQTGQISPDEAVLLPSESQWEKAARGPDGRVYPWGNEPDPEWANYEATGIGSTTAVGCFPGGISPYGVQDMSGNVWEWCRTKFEESYEDYRDDNDLEEYTRRVLRGGSFFDDERDVRCAVRYWDYPYDWGRSFGFRVVLSPLTSEL